MFIETETTPNPATLKFLPGRTVMEQGTANFADADAATRSPLALRLFGLDGVTQVFFGADFVTVSKADETSWSRAEAGRARRVGRAFHRRRAATDGRRLNRPPRMRTTRSSPRSRSCSRRACVRPWRGWRRHHFRGLCRRRRLSPDARLMFGLPELDRDLEGRHREHAAPLHSGSRRGSRGLVARVAAARLGAHHLSGASASLNSG